MKKLFSGLLAICFTFSAMNVQAETISVIEPAGEVSGNNIVLSDPMDWGGTDGLMIPGGASLQSNALNNTLTIKNSLAITETDTSVPDHQFNHYIVGGAVYKNAAATGNTVNIESGSSIKGRAVAGGLARAKDIASLEGDKWKSGVASSNTVNITNSVIDVNPQTEASVFSIQGNPVAVAGGASQYFVGNVSGNKVNITNSTITGDVVGGLSYVKVTQKEVDEHEDIDADRDNSNNSVVVTGGTINGNIYGSFGGTSGNNNLVRLDGATVKGNVLVADNGFVWYDGASSSAVASFDNNKLELLNGAIVDSAYVVAAGNINASKNSLLLQDSTIKNGNIYAVRMFHSLEDNTQKISGTTDYNSLMISSTTPIDTVTEIGATLNMTGNPSYNKVTIKDTDVTVVYDANKVFGGKVKAENLTSQGLLATRAAIPSLDTTNGYIFGGVTADYTRKVGIDLSEDPKEEIVGFGSSADNNEVFLQGGTIDANVIGGFASYVREVNYTVTEIDEETGKITSKKEVTKTGRVTTTKTTPYEDGVAGTPEEDSEEADPIDSVFSASNNTVTLQDVTLNGNVYAGYVDGAELKLENIHTKNNKVIISGNTKIIGEVYGGTNASYDVDTNKLIFRDIKDSADSSNYVQFDPSKFHNFDSLYTVEGGYDTRLEFINKDVHASLELNKTAMKVDSQEIIKTFGNTKSGYGHVECNGDPNCIRYTSDVSLSNDRLGIYSYTLTPELETGTNTIIWTLTGKKDQANMEAYGQLPLVGLALASEGGELLTHSVSDAWKSDNEFSTFLNGGYHHTRYETGSGFDLDSGLVQVGAWKKFNEDWLGGFFAKYSNGSYETYPIKVTGSANVFGGGLMTSYRYSETGRLEANVEVGYMDMEFESASLIASFDSKGVYYGASAGFVESLMQDLDLFANINWLRKGDDDITDNLGQKVLFDTMQSLNLRFGADYTLSNINWGGLIPSLGAMGIYEFDGESSVEIDGNKNSDASLKGMSGRGQISLAYQNNDSFLPLRTVFTAYGQLGNRRGFGGEVNISFEF